MILKWILEKWVVNCIQLAQDSIKWWAFLKCREQSLKHNFFGELSSNCVAM